MVADRRGRLWVYVTVLVLGHTFSDFYATAFNPLVATFRTHFGLKMVQISAVGMMLGVFGSMLQPLFGLLGDRVDRGAMAALGIAVSALFVGLIGFAPNVYVLAALLLAGMLGVAAFHPSGAVLVSAPVVRRSRVMGLFLSGGGLGLLLAPLLVIEVKLRLGLPQLWVLAVPGLALAAWMYAATRGEARVRSPRGRWRLRALFAPGTGPVWALFGMAALRAVPVTSFAYFCSEVGLARGWGDRTVSHVLSLFMATGVVGGLMGGWLAERVSHRVLLAGSTLLSAPLFLLFPATRGWASVPALAVGNFVMALGAPLNVALAQELRPQSASAVSGLMMGLAWGVAYFPLLVVGGVAEAVGIERALPLAAALGALGAVLVGFVPRTSFGHARPTP